MKTIGIRTLKTAGRERATYAIRQPAAAVGLRKHAKPRAAGWLHGANRMDGILVTRSRISFSVLVLAAALLFQSTAAAAQPEIVGARVGIADRYKAGLWTQVEVALSGGETPVEGELSVIAPDGDGVPGRVSMPCRLPAGAEKSFRLITRFGRVHGEMTVELRADGRLLAGKTFTTSAKRADADHFLPALEFRKLFVVVGESDLGVEEAGKLGGAASEHRPVVARIDDVGQLPTEWYGYEGVDAVLFFHQPPRGISPSWRRRTNRGAGTLDRAGRPAGRLQRLAGRTNCQRRFSAAAFSSRAGRKSARDAADRGDRIVRRQPQLDSPIRCGEEGRFRSAIGRHREGETILSEADLPLIVRRARGFGQIVFLAGDLDEGPLDRWPDRPMLTAKLLDLPTSMSDDQYGKSGAMMHFGYRDMSGQLRSALDQFDGVRLTPFWLVAALIAIYILLIGPGDYFLLRKFVGRMQLTWITFPLIVAAVCLGAFLLARGFKGDRFRTNQIDLVDVDTESGLARGASWANVFSPRTDALDISFRPRASDARTLVGWLGLPGGGLGGMNPRAATPTLWTEDFLYAKGLNALLGMPIQIWSSKSLTTRWEAAAASCPTAEFDRERSISLRPPGEQLRLSAGTLPIGIWTIGL